MVCREGHRFARHVCSRRTCVGSVKGVEAARMRKGGCGSKVYQKCLYIIAEVAVRLPFFLKSFTCARPR
eukprot:1714505-Prymnesium_polylepis.2